MRGRVGARPLRRAITAAVALSIVTGCGSAAAPSQPAGTATSPAESTTASTTTTAAASGAGYGDENGGQPVGAALTVSGALTLTLTEDVSQSANRCSLDGYGSGRASDLLYFDAGAAGGVYLLQLSLPSGTTTFPDSTASAGAFFYDSNDSAQEWGAASVTATRSADNSGGTVDVMMADAAPPGSPPLQPIQISGSFICP